MAARVKLVAGPQDGIDGGEKGLAKV